MITKAEHVLYLAIICVSPLALLAIMQVAFNS